MFTMQPESRERALPRGAFRLRYLIVVVNGNVLDAAGMNVYPFAQGYADHRGAFDVPSRKTFAPRAFPAQLRVQFPEREVGRIALSRNRRYARAFLETFQINAAELPVAGETLGVEIYAVAHLIRITLFLKRLYHRNLRGHMIARAGELYLRCVDVELFKIGDENVGVPIGEQAHIFERELQLFALEAN